ncbi:MAG: prepilin-type N-terminal cleavage/methylation domain-containing protein, partial [Pseudomonadota bacterium]
MPRSLNGQDRGISLIEMVIAVLILSIGVAAGFQSLAQARKGIGEEVPRLIAREVAMNHAEALQLFGIGADLA